MTPIEELEKAIDETTDEAMELLRKSQMAFDFSAPAAHDHHVAYTRTNKQGTVSQIKQKGVASAAKPKMGGFFGEVEAEIKDKKKREEIKAYADTLKKRPKSELIQEVKQKYRIIDTSDMDKHSAVNYLLESRYGNKTLKEHYYTDRKPKKEPEGIVYFKGDKAKLTGTVEQQYGGTFHEVEMLEGHMKGQKKWVVRSPAEQKPATPTDDPVSVGTYDGHANKESLQDAKNDRERQERNTNAVVASFGKDKSNNKQKPAANKSAHEVLEQAGMKHKAGEGYKPELDPYQHHVGTVTHGDIHKHLVDAGYKYTNRGNDTPTGDWHSYERSVPYTHDRITLYGNGTTIKRATRFSAPARD